MLPFQSASNRGRLASLAFRIDGQRNGEQPTIPCFLAGQRRTQRPIGVAAFGVARRQQQACPNAIRRAQDRVGEQDHRLVGLVHIQGRTGRPQHFDPHLSGPAPLEPIAGWIGGVHQCFQCVCELRWGKVSQKYISVPVNHIPNHGVLRVGERVNLIGITTSPRGTAGCPFPANRKPHRSFAAAVGGRTIVARPLRHTA